mmetsp:Transcript_31623/g.101111  ORF Transcript_31623/g.101111 Transcript_31623/m.101111 type:complete len:346 (-) Transcript_31623:56-1093(-)
MISVALRFGGRILGGVARSPLPAVRPLSRPSPPRVARAVPWLAERRGRWKLLLPRRRRRAMSCPAARLLRLSLGVGEGGCEQHAHLAAANLLAVPRCCRRCCCGRLEADRRLALLGKADGGRRAAGLEEPPHCLEAPLLSGQVAHEDAALLERRRAEGELNCDGSASHRAAAPAHRLGGGLGAGKGEEARAAEAAPLGGNPVDRLDRRKASPHPLVRRAEREVGDVDAPSLGNGSLGGLSRVLVHRPARGRLRLLQRRLGLVGSCGLAGVSSGRMLWRLGKLGRLRRECPLARPLPDLGRCHHGRLRGPAGRGGQHGDYRLLLALLLLLPCLGLRSVVLVQIRLC